VLNSSVLRWLQKQDDDEDKSQMAAGREFQAAGPQTAKLHVKSLGLSDHRMKMNVDRSGQSSPILE